MASFGNHDADSLTILQLLSEFSSYIPPNTLFPANAITPILSSFATHFSHLILSQYCIINT